MAALHGDTEQFIAASGLESTIIRPRIYPDVTPFRR
jgi:uncharacterized protein YbjT (DUF2867 family)